MSFNGWQEFIDLCKSSIKANNFDELMQVLLTLEEKEQFSTRVLLLQQLLQAEKSQREIAKDLHISISKITRGSNELKRSSTMMLDFLKDNLTTEKQ